MRKANIIPVKSESEFLQVQAQLKSAGFSLVDYNEYFCTETWSNGKQIKTIKLIEE